MANRERAEASQSASRPDAGAGLHSLPTHRKARAGSAGIERYRLGSLIAVGGMGALHFGVLSGAAQFSRLVAIKRLHAQLAIDPKFRARFVEEARLNAQVQHANVVQLLDVVDDEGELWLVMEYVDGVTLHALQVEARAVGRQLPLNVVTAILIGTLEGLHAAHETTDASGRPLGMVHRDVSPQNVMLSRHGQVKVIDFGIAKATVLADASGAGRLVGKLSYMSPEQASGGALDRRSDIFSAGVLLWEALTGRRLFREEKQPHATILRDILRKPIPCPSLYRPDIPPLLDAAVMRALRRNAVERYGSAREFAEALSGVMTPAAPATLGAYVTVLCEAHLARRPDATPLNDVLTHDVLGRVSWPLEGEEELTSLALTGQISPVADRPVRDAWRERAARGAAILALALGTSLVARALLRSHSLAQDHANVPDGGVPNTSHHTAPPLISSPAAPAGEPSPSHVETSGPKTRSSLDTARPQPGTASTAHAIPKPALHGAASAGSAHRATRFAHEARAAVTVDCSTPTYLGEDGIQHFLEQCL